MNIVDAACRGCGARIRVLAGNSGTCAECVKPAKVRFTVQEFKRLSFYRDVFRGEANR